MTETVMIGRMMKGFLRVLATGIVAVMPLIALNAESSWAATFTCSQPDTLSTEVAGCGCNSSTFAYKYNGDGTRDVVYWTVSNIPINSQMHHAESIVGDLITQTTYEYTCGYPGYWLGYNANATYYGFSGSAYGQYIYTRDGKSACQVTFETGGNVTCAGITNPGSIAPLAWLGNNTFEIRTQPYLELGDKGECALSCNGSSGAYTYAWMKLANDGNCICTDYLSDSYKNGLVDAAGNPVTVPNDDGTYLIKVCKVVHEKCCDIKISSFTASGIPGSYSLTGTIDNPCNKAISWTITVSDSSKNAVWSKSGTGSAPAATWNGKDTAENPVPQGQYTATLTVSASSGSDSTKTDLTVTPPPPPPPDPPVSPPKGPDTPSPIDPAPTPPNSPVPPLPPGPDRSPPKSPGPSPQVCAASSAHLGTGNLYHDQQLFKLTSMPMLDGVTLSYATSAYSGPLGQGWSHNHDIGLIIFGNGNVALRTGMDDYRLYRSVGTGYVSLPGDTSVLTNRSGGGYVLNFSTGTVYEFAADGTIASVRDVYGNLLAYTYTSGDLTAVTDSSGRSIGFDYDSTVTPHRLIGLRDPKQTAYSFSYNSDGRLQRVVLPAVDGGAQPYWEYTYYPDGRLQTKRDPLGNVSQYEYDNMGRLTKAIDPGGATDPVGHTRSYAYDSATGAVPRSNVFTEKDGSPWTHTFDAMTGLVSSKKDPNNQSTDFSYYGDGRLKSTTFAATGGTRLTTFYAYDQNGSVTIATLPAAGIDPATVIDPATDNRLTVAFRYSYDTVNSNPVFRNRIKTVSDERDPARILTTSYDYSTDVDGYLVTTVTDPAGAIATTRQFANGKVKDMTDANSAITGYTYRPDGLLDTVTAPDGTQTIFTGYDAAGNATEMNTKDATGAVRSTTTLAYDVRNRLTASTTTVAGQTPVTVAYGYDANDNRTSVIDAEGNETRSVYNYNRQVTSSTQYLKNALTVKSISTSYQYGGTSCPSCGNGVDKLTAITDAKGQTTAYQYDLLGRLEYETDPLGRKYHYTYYENGQVKEKYDASTTPETLIVGYQYNNRGQVTSKQYADGTSETFSYDANGRLQTVTNQHISYTLEYYANGRLKSITDNTGRAISYDLYDNQGQRTRVTVSDGADQRIINYDYDTSNRPWKITTGAGTFEYRYDELGRRQRTGYPNGVTATYQYDELNRLTSLTHAAGTTTIAQANYTDFDKTGNRKNKATATTTENYGYDTIYRLLTVTGPKQEAFQYDDVGNRTQGPSPKDTVYQHDAANRMTQGRKLSYGYDNVGNQTTKTITGAPDKTWVQTWNLENRLLKVEKTKGAEKRTVEFKYDPFGRRIEKKLTTVIDGVTKTATWTYVYDGDNIALEINTDENNSTEKTWYTHGVGVDEHLAMERGGQSYYFHADGLGSITAITDSSRNVVQRYSYDSFGMPKPETSFRNAYTYAGREWDREIGLYFNRARYYDPMEGRFISRDPIGFKGGINLYNYVDANPISRTDPRGLEWRNGSYHYSDEELRVLEERVGEVGHSMAEVAEIHDAVDKAFLLDLPKALIDFINYLKNKKNKPDECDKSKPPSIFDKYYFNLK